MRDLSFWNHKNVFVTGGTGFLGSYIIKMLVDRGANVTALVRDNIPKSNLFKGSQYRQIAMVYGDLCHFDLINRSLAEYEIDTVFHLGAQAIVGVANHNPMSTFETNIRGTYTILEACRLNPTVKGIIVASSDKAYGDQEILPYHEEMPLQGTHPYDVSKSCTDLIAQAYYKTYQLPVCITRCGNLFGGGDLNFNRIIPQTIRNVINDTPPVIRSDGSFIRDYFYVEDAAEAYLQLAEKMRELNIYGEAFNFSNENQLTVIDLVKKILLLMKSDLVPVVLNMGQGEIKHQYLCADKAKKVLGWEPAYHIDESLEKTIKWYKENS